MKVGIITCNKANNYGARLQAYALWRYVTMLGHDASVIDYCPPYLDFHVRQWYNPGSNVKEWVKLVVRYAERRRYITKFYRLEEFSASRTRLTPVKYTSVDALRDNPPIADVYIAGSDQIWNTLFVNGRDPAFYLDFGDESTRRISYAASFATEKIENGLDDFVRAGLRRLDAVSVREESGEKIAAGLGTEAAVCCDPAFLLSAEEWEEVCSNDPVKEKFLFVYDFEGRCAIKDVVRKIAKARELKIYSVSIRPLAYSDRDFSDCAPATFLWLVKNADCVVSNSLHGTIFSMIFAKDFFVVDRADGLNVRMHDLTRRYRLGDRIVSADTPSTTLQSHIDYTIPQRLLQEDICRSKDWLARNITARR